MRSTPFTKVLALSETPTASFRIWSWVDVSIFYHDNSYTMTTSQYIYIYIYITIKWLCPLSLGIQPYHPLLIASLLDNIQCPYRNVEGKFSWFGQYWNVHARCPLRSLSLFLQQCPSCLVRFTWMVLKMGDRWPYSWCFVGCGFHDMFNIARCILVQFPSSFFFTLYG